MKKRKAVMAALAVMCAGVIAVGLSGCEWFSFDGRRKKPANVSDTLGYYGSDTAAWLTSQSTSPLELRHEEYEEAIEQGWFKREEVSFIDYLKAMKEDSASLSSALRASVAIVTPTGSAGSGVIYSLKGDDGEDADAYIITNYHVVDNGSSVAQNSYVYLYGDKLYDDDKSEPKIDLSNSLSATYVGGSKNEDIAVLSVTIPNNRRDFVQSVSSTVPRDSDNAKAGEKVYAVGNPLGYGISVVSGTIGMEVDDSPATSKNTQLSMRIDAPVTHGNSGGGLFDREGKLVGIVYGGLEQQVGSKDSDKVSITGFGWAIPANRALSVAQCIIDNFEDPKSTEAKGAATIGILGTLKIESTKGVFNSLTQTVDIIEEVSLRVNSSSPFYKDVDKINGKTIKSIVAKNKDKKTVDLEITRLHQVETVLFNIRNGDTVTLKFTDESSVTATFVLDKEQEINHFVTVT